MSFNSSISSAITAHSAANSCTVFPAHQNVVPQAVSLNLLASDSGMPDNGKMPKITSSFQSMKVSSPMSLEDLLGISDIPQQTELCLCLSQLSGLNITPTEQEQTISQIKQLLNKQNSAIFGEQEIGALLKLLTGSNGIQTPSDLYAARPEVVLEIVQYAKEIGVALPVHKEALSNALALALQYRISTQLDADPNQVIDLTNIQEMIKVAKAYNDSEDIFDAAAFSRIIGIVKNRFLEKYTTPWQGATSNTKAFIVLDYYLKFFNDNAIPYDVSLVDITFKMSAHAKIYSQQDANLKIKDFLATHGVEVIQIEARLVQAKSGATVVSSSTMKGAFHADNLDDSGLELEQEEGASSKIAIEKPVTPTKRAWLDKLPLGTTV